MKQDLDVSKVLRESKEKVAAITADCQWLLVSMEVLEADIKCLRGELRRAEAQSRKKVVSC